MRQTVSEERKIPPVEEMIELYKRRYSEETIRVVYSDITNRIKDLTPIVKDNGSNPLVSREGWDAEAYISTELVKKAASNQSTKDTLEDYELALERLIDGNLGECIVCHKLISSGRITAIPSTSKCADCKSKNPIRVLR